MIILYFSFKLKCIIKYGPLDRMLVLFAVVVIEALAKNVPHNKICLFHKKAKGIFPLMQIAQVLKSNFKPYHTMYMVFSFKIKPKNIQW